MKIQGDLRILTWCPSHNFPENAVWVHLHVTVVGNRESFIPPCEIFFVTMNATYNAGVNEFKWETCFFILIDGLLMCVDVEEVLPDYQVLALYPVIHNSGPDLQTRAGVSYSICSSGMEMMKPLCPGPAKVPSIVEPAEETFHELWATVAG